MTIQDNLNRIQQAKTDIKAAIESKGVYVDEADKIDIYASKIYEIEQGGGSCNLGHLYGDFEDLDGNANCWWYANEQGVDGFNYVQINASQYGQDKYNQGFADGQNAGGGIDIDSDGDGTLENPYQVGQARNIGYALEDGGISDYIHVKGYVSNIDYVNEGGTATYDLNNNMDESIKVQDGLWWHGVVPFDGPWDLEVNDIVVLKCQIEKYEPWEDAGWYDVRIAPNSAVEKLEKPQVDELIVNAEVLDITDNGIYCSKYAELPELNEPLTGDDFYSYAYFKGIEFETNYTWQMDTEIELWFMYDETFQPNQYYPPAIIGNNSYGSIRWNRDDKTNRTWEFTSASSTLFTLEPNVWHKIKLSITDGLWVDDEFIGEVFLNDYHIGKTITISDANAHWYFGMVKINGDIWYPSSLGFKNNNNDILIGDTSKIEYFKKQTPIIVDNLIKQVNVDVPILLGSTKIRFTNSQFTKIPKVKSDGLTDMKEMFKGCNSVTDTSALADLDTKYVTTLEGCFNGFGATGLDMSPLSNWDVSNVTNMGSIFMSVDYIEDYSFMANWDTSNLTSIQSLFYHSNGTYNKIKYVPVIKGDSLTSISMVFSNDTQPTTSLEYFGGFQNMKCNWNDNRGLSATPNITYESCISILNCLYDFTGNGLTPTSSQGNLKVHQNFLDLVGDEISIGTNKGWTITA